MSKETLIKKASPHSSGSSGSSPPLAVLARLAVKAGPAGGPTWCRAKVP